MIAAALVPVAVATRVLLFRLYPALKELVKAKRKKSPGGKTVTPGERKRIIRKFLGAAERILDDQL